jgi:hypothetical protein
MGNAAAVTGQGVGEAGRGTCLPPDGPATLACSLACCKSLTAYTAYLLAASLTTPALHTHTNTLSPPPPRWKQAFIPSPSRGMRLEFYISGPAPGGDSSGSDSDDRRRRDREPPREDQVGPGAGGGVLIVGDGGMAVHGES